MQVQVANQRHQYELAREVGEHRLKASGPGEFAPERRVQADQRENRERSGYCEEGR